MRARTLAVTLIAVLTAACGSSGTKTTPTGVTLEIVQPTNGTTIKGNTLSLQLQVTGINIVKADGDRSGKTGHFHVFIDQLPVAPGVTIPKSARVVHSAENPIKLTGLPAGKYGITVVLGNGAHERLGNVQAGLETLIVEGPAVIATPPAAVSAGQPFVLNALVQGVSLVAADGDTTGSTGHLHLFIDRDPTPAGQAIPKGDPSIIHVKPAGTGGGEVKVDVPALTKGDHVIWVVLGNGAHIPFDPPVLHRLAITVT